jgi:hypothetical protein
MTHLVVNNYLFRRASKVMTLMKQVRGKEIESGIVHKDTWTKKNCCRVICDSDCMVHPYSVVLCIKNYLGW